MRILHITNHVQKIGNGIVNVAVDLACLQAKSGLILLWLLLVENMKNY